MNIFQICSKGYHDYNPLSDEKLHCSKYDLISMQARFNYILNKTIDTIL